MKNQPPFKFQYEEQAIAEHERLSKLFRENRFQFELERKQAIESTIDRIKRKELQKDLKELQAKWDKTLKHSGSAHNRFVMVQMLLWDAVHNQWLPALQK